MDIKKYLQDFKHVVWFNSEFRVVTGSSEISDEVKKEYKETKKKAFVRLAKDIVEKYKDAPFKTNVNNFGMHFPITVDNSLTIYTFTEEEIDDFILEVRKQAVRDFLRG